MNNIKHDIPGAQLPQGDNVPPKVLASMVGFKNPFTGLKTEITLSKEDSLRAAEDGLPKIENPLGIEDILKATGLKEMRYIKIDKQAIIEEFSKVSSSGSAPLNPGTRYIQPRERLDVEDVTRQLNNVVKQKQEQSKFYTRLTDPENNQDVDYGNKFIHSNIVHNPEERAHKLALSDYWQAKAEQLQQQTT